MTTPITQITTTLIEVEYTEFTRPNGKQVQKKMRMHWSASVIAAYESFRKLGGRVTLENLNQGGRCSICLEGKNGVDYDIRIAGLGIMGAPLADMLSKFNADDFTKRNE